MTSHGGKEWVRLEAALRQSVKSSIFPAITKILNNFENFDNDPEIVGRSLFV